ncbi:MAG: glycerophosphodiester phosphodiesterase family protein [Paracoccaceae bacterium]
MALARWRVVLFLFLVMQALALAVIAPTTSALINFAVSLSDQAALTDQDIAMFFLSPAGFVAAIAVVSVILATQIGTFAVMAAMLRLPTGSGMRTVQLAIGHILRRFWPLTEFALRLILRVLGLALPFLAGAGLIFLRNLTEFDINYYLTYKPPEFLWSAGLIAILILAMAAVLLIKLSDWAVSAHLVLFADCPPSKAFAESKTRMEGDRTRLQAELFGWFAVRFIIAQLIFFFFGAVFSLLPLGGETSIRTVVVIVIGIVAVWVMASWLLGAISLGALAVLLDVQFGPQPIDTSVKPLQKSRVGIVAAVIVAAAGIGMWVSTALLDAVKTQDSVEIIAHRGAAGSRPENTMASIEKALDDQADWVEIDVQESLDGQVVVVHDADFMKLAGNPVKVWEADYFELSQIDIGSWYDPIYSDQNPPLLSDVLRAAKGRSKVLIELKHYGHAVSLQQRVVDMVEAEDMADQVAIMSLKYPSVLKVQEIRPEWRTGILAASAVGDLAGLSGDFLAVRTGVAGPRLIRNLHSAGKDLYVWTVNDPLEMSQVMSEGVDGIITDEPALARKVLEIRASLNSAERMALWLASELGLTLNTQRYRDDAP